MKNQVTVCMVRAKKVIQRLFDVNILTSSESNNAKQECKLFIQTDIIRNK